MVEVAYIFFCHAGDEGFGSLQEHSLRFSNYNCVSRENIWVATATIAWSFFEVEEKNDIVPDGESLLNMQVTRRISSLSVAYEWR